MFHSFSTPLTQLCDVIPIALFQLCYLVLYLRRVAACGRWVTAAWLVLYIAALGSAARAPPLLNGSLGYAPALLALFALGAVHYRLHGRWEVLCAALLLCVSLLARTVDLLVCPRWPLGTHFIWHLLNAALLYLLLHAYREATASPAISR